MYYGGGIEGYLHNFCGGIGSFIYCIVVEGVRVVFTVLWWKDLAIFAMLWWRE